MKRNLTMLLVLAVAAAMPLCCFAEEETQSEMAAPAPSHYKAAMVPYDELEPVNHIVILQNALTYAEGGFYTEDTVPAAEEITYKEEAVSAYAMSDVMALLNNSCEGDLTAVNMEEEQTTMTAEQFSGLKVIFDDSEEGKPPVLYNPDDGTEVTDFWYALTAEGEAIFSVSANQSYPLTEIRTLAGWDPEADYTVCAIDKFHIPVTGEFVAAGEIRGTLSGAVNGSFGELPIAGGKINDAVIIQPLQEG